MMTQDDLIQILKHKNKPENVVVIYKSDDPGLKRSPYDGRVVKVQQAHGLINFRYEEEMNKLDLGFKFQAMPRRWGNHVPNTTLIIHKGNFYIEVLVDMKTEIYVLDGIALSE